MRNFSSIEIGRVSNKIADTLKKKQHMLESQTLAFSRHALAHSPICNVAQT